MRNAVFFILPILLISCDPVYVAFLSNHSSWPIYFFSEFESKSASSDTCISFSREDLKLAKPNEREFLWGMMFTKLDEYMAEIGARQVRILGRTQKGSDGKGCKIVASWGSLFFLYGGMNGVFYRLWPVRNIRYYYI